jgi:hypothetical protein
MKYSTLFAFDSSSQWVGRWRSSKTPPRAASTAAAAAAAIFYSMVVAAIHGIRPSVGYVRCAHENPVKMYEVHSTGDTDNTQVSR